MNKKIFDIDLDRCVGCYSCVVTCMDQNDIMPTDGDFMWRDVASLTVDGKIQYASLSCMHCDDAPCAVSCPTGAIYKDEPTGLVGLESAKCIGCRSCVTSCPFGAPKFDEYGKMNKCTGCAVRVENGLIPSCVRTCPTRALKFETVEQIEKAKKQRTLKRALGRV